MRLNHCYNLVATHNIVKVILRSNFPVRFFAFQLAGKERREISFLVFLNNNSNIIINEEFKTEILKSANFVNNSNKIVIHTQKLEGLEYDYGIEILINTVERLNDLISEVLPEKYKTINEPLIVVNTEIQYKKALENGYGYGQTLLGFGVTDGIALKIEFINFIKNINRL